MCQLAGFIGQRMMDYVSRCNNAAIDAKWRGNQSVGKQSAAHVCEWQHACYIAILLHVEVMTAVFERIFNYRLPAGAMEESGIRRSLHISIPALHVVSIQRLDLNRRCAHGVLNSLRITSDTTVATSRVVWLFSAAGIG